MMDKKSNEGLRCIVCGAPAIIDTDPPVCKEHSRLDKQASEVETLDSIEQDDRIWNRG